MDDARTGLQRGAEPPGLSDERIGELDRCHILERAMETLRLGVTVTDPFGTIVYVNPADAALHGYRREELLGRHASIYSVQGPAPPTSRRRTWPWVRARLNRTRDGRTFPVRLLSDAVFDPRGRLQAIVTVCEDISESLLAHEALLQKERVLEAVGFAAQRLLETPRWEDEIPTVLGRLAEATGADRTYLLRPSPDGRRLRAAWAVPDGPRIHRLQTQLQDPERVRSLTAALARGLPIIREPAAEGARSGPVPPFPTEARSFTLVPVLANHRLEAILGVESDDPDVPWSASEVQALALAARVLGAAIRRRELDRLKRAFIATSSHELRSPLTSVVASLDLLRDARAGADRKAEAELLDLADRNARKLLRLTSDLLDLQNLNAGVVSLEVEAVAVGELLQEARQPLATVAGQREIELRIRCSPAPLHLLADRRRLLQVLEVLVSNAVLHGPRGEAVSIVAGRRGRSVVIRVRDRGDGLPPSIHDRLFEAFVQPEGATVRSLGSRGLGLALAHGLVRRMGGSLDLEPAPGGGTRAEITLPSTADPAAYEPIAMGS